MNRLVSCLAFSLIALGATCEAAIFRFDKDPFAGSTALVTPGRQVVGNELFINDYDPTNDVFSLHPVIFGVPNVQFANDVIANIPANGVNTVVLQTTDNDNDANTPFNAGKLCPGGA